MQLHIGGEFAFFGWTVLNIVPGPHVDIVDDCTDLSVRLENDHYELSGVTAKDGEPERGYKLGTLRSLVDTGAILERAAGR